MHVLDHDAGAVGRAHDPPGPGPRQAGRSPLRRLGGARPRRARLPKQRTPGAYGIIAMPFTVRAGIDALLAGLVPTETLRLRNSSTNFENGQRAEAGGELGNRPPGRECSYLRSDTAHGIRQDDLAVAR